MPETTPTADISLIDTNILVYWVDATNISKHQKAKEFLERVSKDPNKFVISLQNLREFSSVLIAKKKVAREQLSEYLTVFLDSFEVLSDNAEDTRQAAAISLNQNAPFWDALLVCTMQRHHIQHIVTETPKDFANFHAVQITNPLE